MTLVLVLEFTVCGPILYYGFSRIGDARTRAAN
jgi:hypothetical protein